VEELKREQLESAEFSLGFPGFLIVFREFSSRELVVE
jgi:hypothetical protein